MTTITVLDSTGATQTVAKVLDTGSAADAASLPVSQSTEDKAALTSGAQITRLTGTTEQAAAGIVAKATPFGAIAVEGAVTKLFNDSFDASIFGAAVLDTANLWTLSGTSQPYAASSAAQLSLGAANDVSSVMVTMPTFTPGTQPLTLAGNLSLGAQQTDPNAHRFFGCGVVTSYAAATPLTNGFGFEVDVTGALNAVVYVAGVRYVVNSTNPALVTDSGDWAAGMFMTDYGASLTWPTSTAAVLVKYFNGIAYFYLAAGANGLDVPIGMASWSSAASALPIRIANITTPAVSTVLATTFSVSGLLLGITNGTNGTISDPTHSWRQAAVASSTPVTPTSAYTNSAATTNATSTKASAGTLWSVVVSNVNAAVRYLKLYNKASAPTVGTDTPVMTIPIASGSVATVNGGANGLRFSTGIAWALTTGAADSDTGAVAAGEHKVAMTYT